MHQNSPSLSSSSSSSSSSFYYSNANYTFEPPMNQYHHTYNQQLPSISLVQAHVHFQPMAQSHAPPPPLVDSCFPAPNVLNPQAVSQASLSQSSQPSHPSHPPQRPQILSVQTLISAPSPTPTQIVELADDAEKVKQKQKDKKDTVKTEKKDEATVKSESFPDTFTRPNSSSSSQTSRSKHRAWTNPIIQSKSQSHVSLMSSHDDLLSKAQSAKKGKYYCTHCDTKYRTILELCRHMDQHGISRQFHCPHADCPWYVCGFPTTSEWSRHTKAQHGEPGNVLGCPICLKPFARKDSLKRHHHLVHENQQSRYNKKQRTICERKQRAGGGRD